MGKMPACPVLLGVESPANASEIKDSRQEERARYNEVAVTTHPGRFRDWCWKAAVDSDVSPSHLSQYISNLSFLRGRSAWILE